VTALSSGSLLVLIGAVLTPALNGHAAELTLVDNSRSDYRIVVADSASTWDQLAAKELQRYLREISGVPLAIVNDEGMPESKEILIGTNRHFNLSNIDLNLSTLDDEGFRIETAGEKLVIIGGPVRGSLYGVYTLLEDYLGCRWYSSKVSVVPRRSTVRLPPINTTQKPAFKFREVFYRDLMNPEFAARLKLNGNSNLKRDQQSWGTWCHSLYSFVPPEKYFDTHPEYFSLIDGKRAHTYNYDKVVLTGQLCFSEPGLKDVMIASLRERMATNPNFQYWSISQNDSPVFCQCDRCATVNEREDSPMGTMLDFVNQVAAQFPGKTLSTLAYTFSIKPPKFIRAASNVCVVVTTTGITCERPIAQSPDTGRDWPDGNNAKFRRYLEQWSRAADDFYIWDYEILFTHLLAPFPNLRNLQPNLKLFLANKAQGVFAQGNREVGGEFCELRAYLLAKLLWNPNVNLDLVLDDFLAGYYGAASLPIRKYIDLMHDALSRSSISLTTADSLKRHAQDFLAPDLLDQYEILFDQAERLVANQTELLERVQTARMPLIYAQLELQQGTVAKRTGLAKKLFEYAERAGLEMFSEVELTRAKYKTNLMETLTGESHRENDLKVSKLPLQRSVVTTGSSNTIRAVRIDVSNPRLAAWAPTNSEYQLHWRFPRLNRWPGGKWTIASSEINATIDSDGSSNCLISNDDGRTWSAFQSNTCTSTIFPTHLTWFNDSECFYINPTSSVLFPYSNQHMREVRDLAIYGSVKFEEPDEGLKSKLQHLAVSRYDPKKGGWREETASLDVPHMLLLRRGDWLDRPSIESYPVKLRDGSVWVADHRIPVRLADGSVPMFPPVSLFSSKDRGRTWRFEQVIVHDPSRFFVETQLATTPDDGLLCLLRTTCDDKPSPVYLSRKAAKGKWNKPEILEKDAAWPSILNMGNGVSVFVYSSDGAIWMRTSTDPDCRGWSEAIKVAECQKQYSFSGTGPLYASVQSVSPTRLLIAYGDYYRTRLDQLARPAVLVRDVELNLAN
jgi:hypothetical protein